MPGRGAGAAPLSTPPTAPTAGTGAARPSSGASTRPLGPAKGVAAYVCAWMGMAIIALLTGAASVLILLTAGAVAAVMAACSGWFALRGSSVDEVRTATVATAGDELGWTVHARTRRPLHVVIAVADDAVADGWVADGRSQLTGCAPRRGVHHAATVTWSTAGRVGMVWWRRRAVVPLSELYCGPAPAADPAPAEPMPDDATGVESHSTRSGHDDVDGVRQWRDGDEVTAVHWPSTLRVGEFVVRERSRDRAEHWVVTARSGTGDPDVEAARVRRALDDCMSRGNAASVRVDGGEPVELNSAAAVVQWCAAFEATPRERRQLPFWKRPLGGGDGPEPDTTLDAPARWAVAAACAVPLVMLMQPLGYGPAETLVILVALAGAAAVTTRRPPVRQWLRQLLGLVVGCAVALTLIDISQVAGVMTALRYVMPQMLIALCVVQGFECLDRRGARVSLACAGLLTAYAAGVRVDGALGPFLLVALVAMAVASATITRRDRARAVERPDDEQRHPPSARHRLAPTLAAVSAVAAVAAILAVIPVPKGPAQLNLPSWLSERRPTDLPGELAAPDGSPLLGGALLGGNSRNANGAGGYPGFSPVMNTSLRGDMGDQVVLRVRANAPDFWRGQTFTRFDGTQWYIETGNNALVSNGNDHTIPPASGDVQNEDREPDFIQTYYVETDLPNILFAASRPARVLVDGTINIRPDGSLRADFTLPKGSAYTVLSVRTEPTAAGLRTETYAGIGLPDMYLQMPPSTTERTRALAASLADGSPSAYDTVLRIERWLGEHTEYDLDAPVPPNGADAVDHFLFESKRGFCEQIASATAMMLRSVGIPTRIATGYVPSERDAIAGVWISRARDAHAWVEVWFPAYGWVPFDPTASVPLSGEFTPTSIAGELAKALVAFVGDHVTQIVAVGLGLAVLLVAARTVRAWWRRRRRGRWGVLQDRFAAAALARGAPPTAPNAHLAEWFDDVDAAATVASDLDASAFSGSWEDSDERYDRARSTVQVLERDPVRSAR
ncbi:MAG: transglutaminaseTgpA domain-containing protein [Ilumatobacteraceae bacterium]